mgnify:FL=1
MITIDNFLGDKDFDKIKDNNGELHQYFDNAGVHDGKLTSTQRWLSVENDLYKIIETKLTTCDKFKDNNIDGVQVLTAHKPYDVHSDYIVQKNQVPLSDPLIKAPTYTVIIPMSEGYSTVVFEQSANYNNFSQYKKDNFKLMDYCPDETWSEYCSHCHKQDQKYLSINEIFQWSKGTLFAFNRRLFHCSSNFQTPKQAIVLWLSK